MTEKADFKCVQADLQEAQSEIETASKVDDSLGDSLSFGFRSLLAAVGQLFTRTNDHESKISEHDVELKLIQAQISGLQREIHGLKISRGKAIAARERALAKAQAAVDATKEVVERISIH
jgi:predicted  nucleic acid-binding Zn-ribbon protein